MLYSSCWVFLSYKAQSFQCIMSQYVYWDAFKNLEANAGRSSKFVWPYRDMYLRVKIPVDTQRL